MKKFKALISCALCLSVIFVTACNGDTTSGENSALQTTSKEDNSVVNEAVASAVSELDDEVTLENKVLKWMAWWEIDLTTPAAKLFQQAYGGTVESQLVTYGERYDTLGNLIAAGNSPDMFPFEIRDFPSGIKKYDPIDDIFDVNDPKWAATKDVMDIFQWNGSHYCIIPSVNLSEVWWYLRSVVDDLGFEDPKDMLLNNEWTWDKFTEMALEFQKRSDTNYGVDGFSVQNAILCTTGIPLIGNEDGKLVSNLHNASIEKCMEFFTKLCNENIRYPRHEINNWNVSYKAFKNGETLFFVDGSWRFDEHWGATTEAKKRYDLADDVFFVPTPRDPNADAYYQQGKQDAIMLVKGAPNKQGFALYQDCILLAGQNEDTKLAGRQQRKDDAGWTDELLDFEELLTGPNSPLTFIFDFKNGIGEDIASGTSGDNPIESLTMYPYLTGADSYTNLRAQNEGVINERISSMNDGSYF